MAKTKTDESRPLRLEYRPVGELVDNPRNWRGHPEEQRKALAQLLDEVGWAGALLYNEQLERLVDGHARKAVVEALDPETEVPVLVGSWDENAEATILATLDPLAAMSTTDADALAALVEEIDLSGLEDIDGILADLVEASRPPEEEGEVQETEAPEPPDEAITQVGDLWVLGDHRLLCGDAGSTEDVDRLLDGAAIHLVNTDPPYNVKVEPRSNNAIAAGITSFSRREDLQCGRSKSERGKKDRERQQQKKMHHQRFDTARGVSDPAKARKKMRAKDRPLENDFLSDEDFNKLLHTWFGQFARVLEPGRSFYIWGGYANLGNYPPVLKAHELYFSQGVVWDKEHPVLTRKDFMGAFEICFYGWLKGAGHEFFGPNNATDLWHVKKVSPQKMVHLTEKPSELAARALKYSSKPGENVLDAFAGSGSTLMAAEQLGRHAYLMEMDPAYCDVICERYMRFSGKVPVREKDGVEWSALQKV